MNFFDWRKTGMIDLDEVIERYGKIKPEEEIKYDPKVDVYGIVLLLTSQLDEVKKNQGKINDSIDNYMEEQYELFSMSNDYRRQIDEVNEENLNILRSVISFVDKTKQSNEKDEKDNVCDNEGTTRKALDDFLDNLMETLGITEMDVIGKEYDPLKHQCVDIRKGDSKNIIVEVVKKGYKKGDTIITAPKVIVSR